MSTIHVDIVSAEGEIHSGEATMVYAPASMGEVGIAPRHAPLLTTLKPGEGVTIVTGCNGGPVGAVHWCSDQAVWSNDGDTAIVLDTLGNAVVWYT